MNQRKGMPSKGLLIYFVLCTLAMVWPGALIANRIDPMVLGMPFFMFWYVAWVFALFVGLAIAYRKDSGEVTDHE